jgi:hypothetical protein
VGKHLFGLIDDEELIALIRLDLPEAVEADPVKVAVAVTLAVTPGGTRTAFGRCLSAVEAVILINRKRRRWLARRISISLRPGTGPFSFRSRYREARAACSCPG